MKKVLLLSVIALASCTKEVKPLNLLKSTIDLRASYINDKFEQGYKTLTIEVVGNESFTLETHSNPCLNNSFGFNVLTTEESKNIPYMITTDRDTLEIGVLTFNVSGVKLVKV